MHVQGGDEGLGTVTDVFEFLPPDASGARRSIQMLALDGLDSRLGRSRFRGRGDLRPSSLIAQ
jgi:hypothetical protein